MSNKETDLQSHLDAMEAAILKAAVRNDGEDFHDARVHYGAAIACLCNVTVPPKQLSTLLHMVSESPGARRAAAIITVRALSIDGVLPLDEDTHLGRTAVSLIETHFSDGCKQLRLNEKRQTFEKLDAVKGLHVSICQGLELLTKLPGSLEEIDSLKSEIKRAVSKDLTSAYLQPYRWTMLKNKVLHLGDQISNLMACKDSSYKSIFDQLRASHEELKGLSAGSTFVEIDFLVPFLAAVESAMGAVTINASTQFACNIEPRRKQPLIAEKRYPLHRTDKMLTVTVPMVNSGPGIAADVKVELDGGATCPVALDTNEIILGDIPPGEFAISFKVMAVEPCSTVSMAMQINWNELFGQSKSSAFDLRLVAQNPHVDWKALEQLDPYSLEEADGTQFVGRAAKVQAIGNRLLKAQMTSTYITGQKRVGKTSLAKAVLRYIDEQAAPGISFESNYLEWGEYSTADARSTVAALGEQLFAFLSSHLPPGTVIAPPSFDGSLAPLNAVAKLLETSRPDKRFVIVLDEFDEIHPEMYRFGPLAEVFFANLRTLAAKKNLAFILVGGEKMPFIIGAQGDQLNKFVREPLDYFSRSDEWKDFVQLVTGPVSANLNWEDAALNELFTLTNGHPYYTKLLCSKVFANAVAQRDTEIIVRDVRHALNGRVHELDTNAFAHFWKDGINAEREASEIIELKRLRLLVAFGRACRKGPTSRDVIGAEVAATGMPSHETNPLLDDFCRRDIMKDMLGEVVLLLPIFNKWLQEVGISKLISSTLADELEIEQRKANDKAYVTSAEIEQLVSRWPLYRGREITGETVRAWLQQVEQPQDQRLLFILLQNLLFVTPPQIADGLKYAHERVVVKLTPPLTRANKVEKRRDILVTYLDGPGKSGATYGKAYAKENGLLMESVLEPSKIVRRLAGDYEKPNALVIVDDFSGTGTTISESVRILLAEIGDRLAELSIPVVIVLLYATEEAQLKIEGALRTFTNVDTNVHVCNLLDDAQRAFHVSDKGFWDDCEQRDRAKALCIRLGTGIFKEPLGFGGQALLIAFPDTCPNNNLPVIFASHAGSRAWRALLARPSS